MGGGAKARTLDDHDPVRAPGIRGQLRFWWRALHARQFPEQKKLLEAEAALWGAAAHGNPVRSRVDLWVEILRKSDKDPSEVELGAKDAYALWPARNPLGDWCFSCGCGLPGARRRVRKDT
jgi:CRISPR-associated protein Cmr1